MVPTFVPNKEYEVPYKNYNHSILITESTTSKEYLYIFSPTTINMMKFIAFEYVGMAKIELSRYSCKNNKLIDRCFCHIHKDTLQKLFEK